MRIFFYLICILTLSGNASAEALPGLSQWEAQMQQWGKFHGEQLLSGRLSYDQALDSVYYDGQYVFLRIYKYTNDARYLAYASNAQGMATQAALLATRSDEISKQTINNHPQNIVFYKNRARSLSEMIEIDPKYGEESLNALKTAQEYAPTDAKITYNVGLAYARMGITTKNKDMFDQALKEFKKAILQKPDYRDPYNATALTALAAKDALPEYGTEYQQIAKQTLEKMLEINPDDTEAKALLSTLN